jgi:hypothetical protein
MRPGGFFSANPTEELVDVVDDSHVLLLRDQGFSWLGYQEI